MRWAGNEVARRHCDGEPPAPPEPVGALRGVARSLRAEPDLAVVTEAVLVSIPGVHHAGITLTEAGGKLRSAACSDETVVRLDQVQHRTGQGPCAEQGRFRTGCLAAEARWPEFAQAAVELGIASVLSYPLVVAGNRVGTLTLYSGQRNAFDTDIEALGELVDAYAAVVLAWARYRTHLESALRRRDVIGTAKGIIMQRDRITEQAAFRTLVKASQKANRKLHDIAVGMVGKANDECRA